MDRSQILEKLNDIFRDVLDNDTITMAEETTANDVEEWDSLNHIQLVVAIEKEFKLRFTSKEIQGWAKIGDLVSSIASKSVK
ncbi:MAG TPA: acyl carrier protein [Chryseolinea sp.]|nr:acyl carrier protein [Chryseolinea sp.]